MAIIKRKGKAKPYIVYWRSPATGKQESKSFATLLEARKYESLVKHQLEFEPESFNKTHDTIAPGSVSEVLALYLSAQQFTPKNLKVTLYHLKAVNIYFGQKFVSELTKKDLLLFTQLQIKGGVKPLTVHRKLSILRAALSWAFDQDILDKNPLHGIIISKGTPERIAPPTPQEIKALIEVAPEHLKRAIILAFYLGVRPGSSELFSIKWSDVDFERGAIRIWSAKKNPSIPYRDIPFRSDLLVHVKKWYDSDILIAPEMIVHFNGRKIKSMKRSWATAKKKAKIVRSLRPYDLRHAFATMALDAGADINAVASIMGHSDVTMILKHYHHTKEAAKKNTVESLPCMSSLYVQEKKDSRNPS